MADNALIDLDSAEFSQKLKEDSNGVLLDIRTPQEYEQGHMPNSTLLNIYHPSFLNEIQKLDKNKNYYLYCRSGNRSYNAGELMIELGFKNVYNLRSGILGWHEPLE
jgi:phage shock protein E